MRDESKRRGKLLEWNVWHYEKELAGGQTEADILVIRQLGLFCRRIQFNPGVAAWLLDHLIRPI